MHLNDSTLELGSNRDRHRNIGEETPLAHDKTFSDWKKEIKEIEFLYRLVGKKSLIGPSISSSLSNNNYTTENDSSKIQKPNTNTNKIANKKEKESFSRCNNQQSVKFMIMKHTDKSDIRIYSTISEINAKNPKYFRTKNWISPTALTN
ncbi:2158_t:CDS:2, partial [Entrophospora sp. SA101]